MEKLAIDGGNPVRLERLPIFRLELSGQEQSTVQQTLASGQISRGSLRDDLSDRFCAYTGAAHAVVVNSGTAALHLALQAMNLEEGAEVIMPSLSFVATAFAAEYSRLQPVFAEIDPVTLNISPDDVERKISPRTRSIMPVHFAGQAADLGALYELAEGHDLAIVEDAAHATGAAYRGEKIGNVAWHPGSENTGSEVRSAVAFSLFATKNFTAGEGGIVTTRDPDLAAMLERRRAHGIGPLEGSPRTSGYYDVVDLGYNYHLSDINIALGIAQLGRLDELNRARRERATRLTALLQEIDGIVLPHAVNDHVFHLYNIQLDLDRLSASRDQVVEALLAEGIQVGLYYRPIHLFTYFRARYATARGDLPVTESVCESLVTLPMYPLLTEDDLEDIAAAVRKVVTSYRR